MILPLALLAQLASNCAPSVAVETLAALARTESGLDDTAVHDDTTGQDYRPKTRDEAIALATELVVLDRHSVDLGLMQINSANLPALGLTISDAFDACHSLVAGAHVLAAGYVPPPLAVDEQRALAAALSRYNTGDPVRGVDNGYVRKVRASAEIVVPALRIHGDPADPAAVATETPVVSAPLPPPPARWDVYGLARAARDRGGVVVFGGSRPVPPAPPASLASPQAPTHAPEPAAPAGQASSTQQAMNDAR